MQVRTLYINTDNLIREDLLKDSASGLYINSGSGSWVLKDPVGVQLGNGSLAYVTGTNGRWQGAIPKATAALMTDGNTYFLELTFSGIANGFKRIECTAEYDDE